MNREEYITRLQENLQATLDDYRFNNFKNQIAARKLSADFNATFNEEYIWSKAIYLSSNGCVLLESQINPRIANKALKESAEIFEHLSAISEKYDRDYCLILSALCYDLAGYQANALCLTKTITNYSFQSSEESIDLAADNYVLFQVQQILLKSIPNARNNLTVLTLENSDELDFGIVLLNDALKGWYEGLLNGTQGNFLETIKRAYLYFASENNIHISHLLFLLKSRINVFNRRSIWGKLREVESIRDNEIWHRYIRLLTHDAYDRNHIKNIQNRVSKFEFWTSQLRAVEKGIFGEGNFIIQMPTSAGKTFIAELVILDSLVKHPGRKCIYVAPFRALTNEKEEELAAYISKLGYSVSALSGSYELDEFQDIVLDETDVLIATPEKIDFLFRNNPDYFSSISLIVVDEGHIVGDISSRASLTEFLIARLKAKVANLKTLFISAVMPPENANEYSLWLSGQQNNVIRSLLHPDSANEEEWEPTRKLIGNFTWSGDNGRVTYKNLSTENEDTRISAEAFIPALIKKRQFENRFPDGQNKAQTSASLAIELSKSGNCLVFCSQVRYTESVGKAMLAILELLDNSETPIPGYFHLNTELESYFFSLKWFGAESTVSKCLSRGIGIHYGDMPEAVRRSVESDYVAGNLKVLISTNTIGQGLNFPIKNLIIHSTLITNGQYVSVRDFWNIIGRAGRAGKETEGQIIFVINSYTDGVSYARYTNKINIEAAFSMFVNILNALVAERIDNEKFEQYIEILSESYLLNVLAEEAVETDTQTIIEQIIQNSLFKIQADARKIDITPIRTSFSKLIENIRAKVPNDVLPIFGQTGFVLPSNQAILTYIEENRGKLSQIVEQDNYLGLLEIILSVFSIDQIEEIKSDKLSKIGKSPSEFFHVASMWIEGAEIETIQGQWVNVSEKLTDLNILISDGFYYRYAWGVTAFITILCFKLPIEKDALPVGIKNLSSYLKFGINDPSACLARSLGIKNRDVAKSLSESSNGLTGKEFIKWLANLIVEEIDTFNFNRFDRGNVISIVNKLTPQRYNELPRDFEFFVKGVSFDKERIETSLSIVVGMKLQYERETTNPFDPYAVKVMYNGKQLGYVPRQYSRLISVEIDINDSKFDIVVLDTSNAGQHNNIFIRIIKV